MHSPYTFQQICQIVDGQLVQMHIATAPIQQLLLDSRLIVFPKTALFIALHGKRNDGHNYLQEVYEKGVRNFIISKKSTYLSTTDANVLQVTDSLTALQKLATDHRQQFDIPVIGITGSNGKTIVKEWLFQLMHEDYKIVRSPKSYNSQTGVPLSVWQMQKGNELGIFEAGISQVGEMEKLAPIIDCTIGVFTHIGPAHAAGFDSTDQKIAEKLQLFQHCQSLIYCADETLLAQHIRQLSGKQLLCWSLHGAEADLSIHKLERLPAGATRLSGELQGASIQLVIPFQDKASIHNALHCCVTMHHLGYSIETICERMLLLQPVAMRLELKAGINGCSIINDSYNADIHALQIALDFLDQQSHHHRRCIILSDIFQSGESADSLYRQVADLLKEKQINQLIGIGQAIAQLKEYLPSAISAHFYPTTDQYLEAFDPDNFQQAAVLLKGARPFEFERIANRLTRQVHKTSLEINLNALIHNLNVYSQFLQASTRLMVMVKAAAYGSGSEEVARLLEFLQVDYLSVAYADEGVELREAGIQLPIMVLNPEVATFDVLLRYELEPEIYSLSLLRQFLGAIPTSQKVKIHLKLDTGMHRLGFEAEDIAALVVLLQQHPHIQVQSIFTHLAASESASHDRFSLQQIQRFEQLYKQLCTPLDIRPLRHILNSAGIIRYPQYQMDMVRLGIGLYGVDSSATIQKQLQTVLSLKARISQIKELAAGETVGYGRKGAFDRKARIGTVSIGYADGLLRGAGNGAYQLIVQGRHAPIIGNVCMDMCMIDLTAIPDAKEGDEVIVFGPEQSVDELAKCLGTIPYEIFTNISGRVRRIYFREA